MNITFLKSSFLIIFIFASASVLGKQSKADSCKKMNDIRKIRKEIKQKIKSDDSAFLNEYLKLEYVVNILEEFDMEENPYLGLSRIVGKQVEILRGEYKIRKSKQSKKIKVYLSLKKQQYTLQCLWKKNDTNFLENINSNKERLKEINEQIAVIRQYKTFMIPERKNHLFYGRFRLNYSVVDIDRIREIRRVGEIFLNTISKHSSAPNNPLPFPVIYDEYYIPWLEQIFKYESLEFSKNYSRLISGLVIFDQEKNSSNREYYENISADLSYFELAPIIQNSNIETISDCSSKGKGQYCNFEDFEQIENYCLKYHGGLPTISQLTKKLNPMGWGRRSSDPEERSTIYIDTKNEDFKIPYDVEGAYDQRENYEDYIFLWTSTTESHYSFSEKRHFELRDGDLTLKSYLRRSSKAISSARCIQK
mgnify:CR=1 FL=1